MFKIFSQNSAFIEKYNGLKNRFPLHTDLPFEEIDILVLDGKYQDQFFTENSSQQVIYVGEKKEHAYEAYKISANDFILSNATEREFFEVLHKAVKKLEAFKENTSENYICVRAEYKNIKINLSDLLFVENMRNYVVFRLADGNRILALMSLKSLHDLLPENFLKVHRSFIVNMDRILSIKSNQLSIENYKIPVSKSHRDVVREKLEPLFQPI